MMSRESHKILVFYDQDLKKHLKKSKLVIEVKLIFSVWSPLFSGF